MVVRRRRGRGVKARRTDKLGRGKRRRFVLLVVEAMGDLGFAL